MTYPRDPEHDWARAAKERDARQMATPLAILPNNVPVWEDDLDMTPRERVKFVVGLVLATVFVLACVLVPLAIGAMFGMSGQ